MGATWAFVLIWFSAKWDCEKFQEAVGVKRPLWEKDFYPKFGFTDSDSDEVREALKNVLPDDKTKGERSITIARKSLGPASMAKGSILRRTVAAWVNKVTHGAGTFHVPRIVDKVLVDNDLTPVSWARRNNKRQLVSSTVHSSVGAMVS